MTFIARDDGSVGDLIAWFEGEDEVEAPVQVSCAPNEVAVIVIDGDAAHELGPGRHQLTADSHEGLEDWLEGDDDAVEVAFLTTSPVKLEVQGEFSRGDDEATFQGAASVKVTDASAVIGLLENLGDDESLEDWLGDEVAVHVRAAIDAQRAVEFLAITSGAYNQELEEAALAAANEVLVPSGVTVQSITLDTLEGTEETRHRIGARLVTEMKAKYDAREGELLRECPNGHGLVRAATCPRCKAPTRPPL